jgi:hypothetical protein
VWRSAGELDSAFVRLMVAASDADQTEERENVRLRRVCAVTENFSPKSRSLPVNENRSEFRRNRGEGLHEIRRWGDFRMRAPN